MYNYFVVFEELVPFFNAYTGLIAIGVSLMVARMAIRSHHDQKYARSGTLLLHFKNTIFNGDNLILYKAIMNKYRNQPIKKNEKKNLENKSKLLNFLTEFEVMGSFVYNDIMHKHILFDLFRPILLAINEDDDIKKFIEFRSENAGMPYFTRLKYLCDECKKCK